MSEIAYLNGSLIPIDKAKVSVTDYGFLYGYGLFETIRAYNGSVFCLDRHLRRLGNSAGELGISIENLDLEKAVEDTIRANNLSDARIRISISIGEGSMVLAPDTCGSPTILVRAIAYHPYPEEVYREGFRAIVSSIRRNSKSPLPRYKSANFLESALARREARKAGVQDAIFLNEKGELAEASTSNIFLVIDNVIKTPGLESGILPGITREIVLELAGEIGIVAVEEDVGLDELFKAEEAFITNSMAEIMPLVEVDGKRIGSSSPGTITGRLMDAYRELVRRSGR